MASEKQEIHTRESTWRDGFFKSLTVFALVGVFFLFRLLSSYLRGTPLNLCLILLALVGIMILTRGVECLWKAFWSFRLYVQIGRGVQVNLTSQKHREDALQSLVFTIISLAIAALAVWWSLSYGFSRSGVGCALIAVWVGWILHRVGSQARYEALKKIPEAEKQEACVAEYAAQRETLNKSKI